MADVTFTITDGFPAHTTGRKRIGFRPRAEFVNTAGEIVYKKTLWANYEHGDGQAIDLDTPKGGGDGAWEVHGLAMTAIPVDIPPEGGALEELIVLGIPASAPATTLTAAVNAWMAAHPVSAEVSDEAVADIAADPESATRGVIDARVRVVGDANYAPAVDDAADAGLDYGFAVGYPEAVQLSDSALDAQYAKARAMGAKRIRVVISPADTGSSSYVWTRVDRQFALAAKNGLTPHVLFEQPRTAGGDAFVTPTTAVMTPLITAAVARYKDRCSVWEILNEVNHVTFWGDLPSPSGYKTILQAAYTAIHAAQPHATVVTAGLMQANDYTNSGAYPSLPDGRITVNPVTYLTELYAAGAQGYFDAVGNHPYTLETGIEPTAPVPSESSNAITRDKALYDLMVSNGDAGKKIWWTEVGYPIVTTTTALGYTISQAQAVTYYTTLLQLAARRPWVGPVLAYSIQDLGTDGTNPELVYGQYANGGTAKSAVAWWQTVTKPAGLGLVPSGTTTVDGLTDATTVGKAVVKAADAAAARSAIGAESTANRNAANGYAGLDGSGKVAAAQLPSYVDDVVEAANLGAFPGTGESGKIYVALDTSKTYRWSGSAYVVISDTLAIGTTASTAKAGDYQPAWSDVTSKPAVIAAGADAATARTAIGAAASSDLASKVTTTGTANRLYGTDNAGAQSTLAISANPDSWTVGYRDGSGRMKVNTPADVYDATPKAYVDGKVRTGVFQFEHPGALLTAGSALTYQIRRPFRIPHTSVSSGFRVHLRNRDHLNDANGGAMTNVAIYIGEAAVDATGEINGNFVSTPVQVQASTSVAAGSELISAWIAPETLQISPYKTYLVAYTFTVASGAQYAVGGGRFWYTNTASDVSVVSPSGISRVDNQGVLDLYVEYKFADRDAPVMMIVSNSIAGGGNVGSVVNRAELGAWPMLWALHEKGVAASLAVGGAWCGHFTAASPKWDVYSTLEVPLEVDAVLLFAITSSDIAGGTSLAAVRTGLQVTIAKIKALWPNARIIVTTNSPRSDSSGTPETNRVTFNRELAACPYGAHQSMEINGPFTDWASPERLRTPFQGAPGSDAIHWSEAAHATAAALIPVRYGAIVPHI